RLRADIDGHRTTVGNVNVLSGVWRIAADPIVRITPNSIANTADAGQLYDRDALILSNRQHIGRSREPAKTWYAASIAHQETRDDIRRACWRRASAQMSAPAL